jgi:plastocyanin
MTSFTFAGPGTYACHCNIHPTMVGSVTIAP